jgi:hypothetical protein
MNWLKEHAYLATWLSLLVATIGIVIRNVRAAAGEADWQRAVIYIVLLASLSVAFTPHFDMTTRFFAGYLVSFTLGWIMMDRKR